MPIGGSQSLSKALSGFTLIKYITFDIECLKKASRGVLEKSSENEC